MDNNATNLWRSSIISFIFGFALSALVIDIVFLNYLLPAAGMILELNGLRNLQYDNRHFKYCYRLSAIRCIILVFIFIANTTIYPQTEPLSGVLFSISLFGCLLLWAEMIVFHMALSTAKTKAEVEDRHKGSLFLIVWYAVLFILGLIDYNGLIIPLVMIIIFILIYRSIWRTIKAIADKIPPLNIKKPSVFNKLMPIGLVAILIGGGFLGYLLGDDYPMNWTTKKSDSTDRRTIEKELIERGFPEYIVGDIADADLLLMQDAHRITSETRYNFSENKKEDAVLKTTNIGISLDNADSKWVILRHFKWENDPVFIGTEAIRLTMSYGSGSYDSKVSGRLLYDSHDQTYVTDYYSLRQKSILNNGLFSNADHSHDTVAAFSFPQDSRNQRGYVMCSADHVDDSDHFYNQLFYIHQTSKKQYPIITAEQVATNLAANNHCFDVMSDIYYINLTN